MVAVTLLVWLACALSPLASAAQGSVDWPAVWSEVERIEALEARAPDRARSIAQVLQMRAARDAGPRGALLRATLARLQSKPAALGSVDGWPFDRRESWLAAKVLPEGPQRAKAVRLALGGPDAPDGLTPLDAGLSRLAFDTWVAAAERLDLDDALAIGRSLHERSRATWSAISLALSLMRAGAIDEADAVLAQQIARTTEPRGDLAAMWDHRGIVALGAGRERHGRRCLGRALLLGSVDAGVVLARLDLAQGRGDTARVAFRGALLDDSRSDWARRGWGLSLLPVAPQAPGSPLAGW